MHSNRIEPFCFLCSAVSGSSAVYSTSSHSLSYSLNDRRRAVSSALCRAMPSSQVDTWERPSNVLAFRQTEHLAHHVFGRSVVADETHREAVNAYAMPPIKQSKCVPVTTSDRIDQSFVGCNV